MVETYLSCACYFEVQVQVAFEEPTFNCKNLLEHPTGLLMELLRTKNNKVPQ